MIEADKEIDGAAGRGIHGVAKVEHFRIIGPGLEEGFEVLLQFGSVGEGEVDGFVFKKEVEGIDDCHVGDDIDGDDEVICFFGEDEACEVVTEGVLLPVDEVPGRFNFERPGVDGGAAMWSGPESDDLGAEADGAFVAIGCLVEEGDFDGHGELASDWQGELFVWTSALRRVSGGVP